MTRSNLSRRLALLETRVLPSKEEPRTLIIQFVGENGEIVSTMPVTLDRSTVHVAEQEFSPRSGWLARLPMTNIHPKYLKALAEAKASR